MALLRLFFLSLLTIVMTLGSDIPPLSLKPSSLVEGPLLKLAYHKGPLLTGDINLYLLWYGQFPLSQKSIILDFLASLSCETPNPRTNASVHSWWATLSSYEDSLGHGIRGCLTVVKQAYDEAYTLGKTVRRIDLKAIVLGAIAKGTFPLDPNKGIYIVLSSRDIGVERFCLSSCGFHEPLTRTKRAEEAIVMGWVGDSSTQCPGECAWPLAKAQYGPHMEPLKAPNGDIGGDGMVMNLGVILAGALSNPYGSGYFQGNALAPLEAGSACAGVFGTGAYPGYPGVLLKHPKTGASFNAYGVRNRTFILPALWDPKTLSCKTPLA
ncbi:hypothetical protein AMTRI_Chr02g219580 [Amborella trichopoda]